MYRICERKNDKIYTLFHPFGNPRNRELPIGEWLYAEIKDAWDGSRKTAKRYKSGFHVFEDSNECEQFITMFRAPRELVMIEVDVFVAK